MTAIRFCFRDRIKGTARAYLPYPTQLPFMQAIMALDPSA